MFQQSLPYASHQIDCAEFVAIPSSSAQTSQLEDRPVVDSQVEVAHQAGPQEELEEQLIPILVEEGEAEMPC